ncbi:addiction module protein [Myxococcota bacterium]|nr:addiction module protein [Myxococcota bacterium]MBU1511504.1 addiction module protein [Myxococcota bacterium]
MSGKEILEQALKLKPDERFSVIEALLKSLDTPDASLDSLWADEAEKRLHAYRAGNLAGIPFDEVFAEH